MCSGIASAIRRTGQSLGEKGKDREERTRVEDVDERGIIRFGRRKGFTTEDEDAGTRSGHSVAGTSIWRWTHILEHEPSLVCQKRQSDMHSVSIIGQWTHWKS
jgi:hypothetical protein